MSENDALPSCQLPAESETTLDVEKHSLEGSRLKAAAGPKLYKYIILNGTFLSTLHLLILLIVSLALAEGHSYQDDQQSTDTRALVLKRHWL